MKIMIGIGHPKRVHLFKNVINNLISDGHEVKIVAWDKDITLPLLNIFGLKYELMGKSYKGLIGKAFGMLENDLNVLKIAKKFKPDILISGAPYMAHVSRIIGKPSIQFWDTEHANLAHRLTYPFTDAVCTPSSFKRDLGKKHVRYNGYYELSYLHPNYFKPDPSVLYDLGLSRNDTFFFLRFVAQRASHDVGYRWFDFREGQDFIKFLEDYGDVFISSEDPLPKNLIQYQIPLSIEKIHHLLYYATMYIGGSGTMATESALLGTTSIHITSPVVVNLGNFEELEKKYGLMYNFDDSKKALTKVLELLREKDLKSEWQKKKNILLNEKIDVTKFITWFIEEYPESFYSYNK